MATMSNPPERGAVIEKPALAESTQIALRRIPLTADVLSPANAEDVKAFQQTRLNAVKHFYLALNDATQQLSLISKLMPARPMPSQLLGTLVQPDGTPAHEVQVGLDIGSSHVTTITNDQGAFLLSIPGANSFPENNKLQLTIHGANGNAVVTLDAAKISRSGLIGNIPLPSKVAPLPVSIVQSLKALLPAGTPTDSTQIDRPPVNTPVVTLGEEAGKQCQIMFRTDYTVDKFPFAVFFRLVEPRTSIVTSVFRFPGGGNKFLLASKWDNINIQLSDTSIYVDRTPVEQPISVDGFRDQIVGLDGSPVVGRQETVPMAGTLGLGYILQMAQTWTPKGYALGNLVYSLPLAPGEQERVAIFERVDTSSVRESEFMTQEEIQSFSQTNDSSANATFTSAFNEMARGGSHFDTQSSSESWGGSIIIVSGGGGSSQSSGNSSSWLEGQRNSVQRAAQDAHATVQRQAAARRSAFRTGMRLATATESENATTKVITNHNHTRALTLQYWEVQRLFDVTTGVEGATLVCLVPLEIVRFLPPGQPFTLSDASQVATRAQVLGRYGLVLKHADVLSRCLPRGYQYGLTLLTQFAGDPRADVQKASSAAEDVIQFSLTGTFLPFESIYVTAVTRRGTRIGPARLSGAINPVPDVHNSLKDSFPTRDALIGYLRTRRSGAFSTLGGRLAIPPALARNDIVGFEISRGFRTFDYDLVNQQVLTAVIFGVPIKLENTSEFVSSTIHLSPQQLESQLGGPILEGFSAVVLGVNDQGKDAPDPHETYANDSFSGVELPSSPMPVPALQLTPVLRYSQILEIEKMAQHVVRNTVAYSKAVWWSLTAEERAIMLEGFTIGVPPDGVADETQMVPLLNCVENRVLGFYGNSMIMPFIIPRSVADSMKITSKQVQDMLTDFHKTAFDPPKATVALPTRGVLGEAILGSCPSAERIDLTRFWNWADAPADTAPDISPVQLPTTQPSIAAGLTAPSTLGNLPTLINNFNAGGGPTVDTSLLTTLANAAAAQKDFSTELTGAALLAPLIKNTQDTAEKARADALKTTKDLSAQAMATVGNIVGGIYAKNPTAGSDALKAMSGGGGGATEAKKDGSATAGKDGGTSGSGSGGGSGGNGSSSGSGGTGGNN